MKILITGGNGQLGTQLQKDIRRGVTELGMPLSAEVETAKILAVDLPDFDISNANQVWDCYEDFGPDLVINCAAMTNVDGCEENPKAAMLANNIGAANLAKGAEIYGAAFVHVSTDYVFAGDDPVPRCEWDATLPVTVYGKSKLMGEEAVLRAGIDRFYIFRTAWLYGYHGNNFVRTMIRLMREKGKVSVVNDQFGNPTSASDLSHTILQTVLKGAPSGVYHASCSGTVSWYEFTCKIKEIWGIDAEVLPCTTAEFPRLAKRPAYSSLRNLMLESTVGDEMRPWEEALLDFYKNDKE